MEVKMSQASIPALTDRKSDESIFGDQAGIQSRPTVSALTTISKIGRWSALLTSICGVGYGMAVIAVMVSSLTSQLASAVQGWTGIVAFWRFSHPSRCCR